MNRGVIKRISDDGTQTLGEGEVHILGSVVFKFKTLELPWKNNERRVSCIPKGVYKVIKHTSPKFGPCYWLQNVPNRSEILIHPANYYTQLLGCIAPGDNFVDINKDGFKDVTNSKNTMAKLLSYDLSEIEII